MRGSSRRKLQLSQYLPIFPISYSMTPLEMSKSFDGVWQNQERSFSRHFWDAKSIKATQEHLSYESPNCIVEILWGNLYKTPSQLPTCYVCYILYRNKISSGIFFHSALACSPLSIFCSFTCLCVSKSQRKKQMEKVRRVTYVYHPFFTMHSKKTASEESP